MMSDEDMQRKASTLKRRVFNLAAMVSLLLCVATAGLWVYSEFRAASLGYGSSRDASGMARMWEITSTRGAIRWTIAWHWLTSSPEYQGLSLRSGPPEPSVSIWMPNSTQKIYGVSTQNAYGVAGFYGERYRAPAIAWDRRTLQVPDWFLISALLMLPAMRWERHWVKRGLPAPGCCPICGYDLRATPDRCPECGRTAPTQTAA